MEKLKLNYEDQAILQMQKDYIVELVIMGFHPKQKELDRIERDFYTLYSNKDKGENNANNI